MRESSSHKKRIRRLPIAPDGWSYCYVIEPFGERGWFGSSPDDPTFPHHLKSYVPQRLYDLARGRSR